MQHFKFELIAMVANEKYLPADNRLYKKNQTLNALGRTAMSSAAVWTRHDYVIYSII